MATVRDKSRVYSIYAGDFQTRTPQDQGPVQNAAFDKGIVSVALSSLYADASSPTRAVELVRRAYRFVDDPGAFTGITGMGDYLHMGCEQEMNRVRTEFATLAAANPALRFSLVAPGNHDGGQYMGVTWNTRNFFNLTGIVYPDLVLDAMTGACGEGEFIEERRESVRELDAIARREPDPAHRPFGDIVSHVKHGGRYGYRTRDNGRRNFYDDAEDIFGELWRETPELDRWDAIIHYDRTLLNGHVDEDEPKDGGAFAKLKEFGKVRGDVKQWIHLQAERQAVFSTPNGGTVPMYEIALDTMDFTKATDFSGAVLGHVSEFQVSIVANFIDEMLRRDPDARFKIVMHYPFEDLAPCSRAALRRLFEREEVILVVDAHIHERGFDPDVRTAWGLDRKTPLIRLTVPSTFDMPSEVVLEEMAFFDSGGDGRIAFTFRFEGLPETEIPGAAPIVFEALEYFETLVTARKQNDGLPDGGIYLNEEEVIAGLDKRFQRMAASHVSRKMQVRVILNLILSLQGRASRRLIGQASLRQMHVDFGFFLEFLDIVSGLLKLEQAEKAERLNAMIAGMRAQYEAWRRGYERRRDQGYPDADLKVLNSLYTDARLDDVFQFISEEIPSGSHARAFLVIAGRRASAEEARYHGFDENSVPDEVTAEAVVRGVR